MFFVEESVNDDQDGHFDRVHAIRGMEGIVRRVREKCPRCESVENFLGEIPYLEYAGVTGRMTSIVLCHVFRTAPNFG